MKVDANDRPATDDIDQMLSILALQEQFAGTLDSCQ